LGTAPHARTEGLLVESIDTGLVLYDAATSEAHSLDLVAAEVWRAADGTRDAAAIATLTGLDVPQVEAALDQLQARGLLLGSDGVSRRAALRHGAVIGAAAVAAAPLIETLVIPTAAAHASMVQIKLS
jgi:Coenzyme PQQ synthesis protein D (PqqD)